MSYAGGQACIGTTGSCHVLVVPGPAINSPLAQGIWQVRSITVYLHFHKHNSSFFKEVDNKVVSFLMHLPLVYRKRELTFVIKGVVMMA